MIYTKTAASTIKANASESLIMRDSKSIFDFTKISDIDGLPKNAIITSALKNISVASTYDFIHQLITPFECYTIQVEYTYTCIYDAEGYKQLYKVFKAEAIQIIHGTRNSIYDEYTQEITNIKADIRAENAMITIDGIRV